MLTHKKAAIDHACKSAFYLFLSCLLALFVLAPEQFDGLPMLADLAALYHDSRLLILLLGALALVLLALAFVCARLACFHLSLTRSPRTP